MSFAIHKYFNENDFNYLHTPLITASDAEGAGEMFRVTTLDMKNLLLQKKVKLIIAKISLVNRLTLLFLVS